MAEQRGIFVIIELPASLAEGIASVQRANDPRLAALWPPHVTLIGSSGAGPIFADTPIGELKELIGAVAARTAPIALRFGAPVRFPDRDIVSLPLDPHGPLRALHEALRACGLRMHRARYPFTPHCTLTMYPPLSRERERRLTTLRFDEPFQAGKLRVVLTQNPQPARLLFDAALGATAPS
jgi:2'-5' RNA ligase